MVSTARFKLLIEIGAAAALAMCVSGCGKGQEQPGGPPPPAVLTSLPVQREVIEWDDFTGHLEAPESVTLAARVSGLIESMPFVEGSLVKKGQVLCTIDVRPFQAELDAELGNQVKAKAQVDIAQSNFDREDQALKGNAVSQQDYDNAKATLEQNKAAFEAAKAAVESARLNVEFCKVISPIDGRVSNKQVTVGNLISGGGGGVPPTTLTTIQSIDPIYCYVDVDENSLLKYQKLGLEIRRASGNTTPIPCFLELGNETRFPREGFIDFIDNHVDSTTGTLKVRGVFRNTGGEMTPGLFATMRIPGSGKYQTLLVPDKAVGTDQSNRLLMVVGDDGKAMAKNVVLGPLFGSLRSIDSGISPGDKVIVDGLMRVRPGVPVQATDQPIQVDEADFVAGTGATTRDLPTSQPTTDLANMQAATAPENSTPAKMPATEPAQ